MKIATIRHSIRNRGGDRLVLEYLAALADQGAEIVYWTNEVNTAYWIHPQIQIRKIPLPGVLGTILFTLFSKFPADVVLVDLVLMAVLAHNRNKKRILYLAQDNDVEYYNRPVLRALTERCYRKALRQFKIKTIAVSFGLAEAFQKYEPFDLTVIPNGVDLKKFFPDPNSTYTAQKQGRCVILYFARSDYRKGLDVALATFEHLKNILPGPSWEIWTIGPEKIDNPHGNVKNFGFIRDEAGIRDILSAADIFFVSSRSEGLGLLLLQAIACGCAIVTTTASSIIKHEVNGLVSPIEDAKGLAMNLKRAVEDPGLLKQLKAASRALSHEYDSENSKKIFSQYIQNAFAQNP